MKKSVFLATMVLSGCVMQPSPSCHTGPKITTTPGSIGGVSHSVYEVTDLSIKGMKK